MIIYFKVRKKLSMIKFCKILKDIIVCDFAFNFTQMRAGAMYCHNLKYIVLYFLLENENKFKILVL